MSRRSFIERAAGACLATALPAVARSQAKQRPVCVFSKHLGWLDYDAMAGTAAEIGFDGVDLTVRPGGHVLPERAADDLPRAVEAVRRAGLEVYTITTAITDAGDPQTETVVRTAAGLGIGFYRTGYLDYRSDIGVAASLESLKPRMRDLAALNRQHRIHGAYQNHAGRRVGATVWDLWVLLRDLDPRWIGCQYDIRHATAEGGHSWPLGLELVLRWVRTSVVKDFRWSKDARGRWRDEHVPIGEGMVDFPAYFRVIREHGVAGPISFHFEYPLTQEPEEQLTSAQRRQQTMAAMRRDLQRIRALLEQAGLGSAG